MYSHNFPRQRELRRIRTSSRIKKDSRVEMVVHLLMLEKGLASPEPGEDPMSSKFGEKLRTALDSLTPEEKRTARRKFRKLWRKAAGITSKQKFAWKKETAAGSHPDSHARAFRRAVVDDMFRQQAKKSLKK